MPLLLRAQETPKKNEKAEITVEYGTQYLVLKDHEGAAPLHIELDPDTKTLLNTFSESPVGEFIMLEDRKGWSVSVSRANLFRVGNKTEEGFIFTSGSRWITLSDTECKALTGR